jgi:hypothetical protein
MALGELTHPLADALHAPLGRPPMEVVAASATLQQPSRDPGMEVAAEKVEALPTFPQVHLPGLVRVQRKAEDRHDLAQPLLGPLDFSGGAAEHHKIVGIPHEDPDALLLPDLVEQVQVDVGEQRRFISSA